MSYYRKHVTKRNEGLTVILYNFVLFCRKNKLVNIFYNDIINVFISNIVHGGFMSRKARFLVNSLVIHNISRGFNGANIFECKGNKERYLYLLKTKKEKYNIKILSYCIMDNHVHLIIHADEIKNVSNYMHDVNTEFGIYYNRKNNRVGYVFQGRYKSIPMKNIKQLITCMKYIHMNPVKAKIVKKEEEYEFSSYKWYKSKSDIIDYKVLIDIFKSIDNCIKALNSEEVKYIEKSKEKMIEQMYIFANNNGTTLEEIGKKNTLIKQLYNYLNKKELHIYKNEFAKQLNIQRSRLYRILK